VEVAEQFADGQATEEELATARETGRPSYVYHSDPAGDPAKNAANPDAEAATQVWGNAAHFETYVAIHVTRTLPPEGGPGRNDAYAAACNLLRDIFGNPFRPLTFSPDWRTDTVVALAQQMYDSREFSAMPILADALQDAGCDSHNILNHCRDLNQVHVRGCWVVDLVLGKG
jgi:hypothetical protein